jgi:hypothetical protein
MTAKKPKLRLSPQAKRARELIEKIAWNTEIWLRYKWATPRLPAATEAILHAAAAGKAIDPAELAPVMAAAEALDSKLAWGTLKRFPRIEDLT